MTRISPIWSPPLPLGFRIEFRKVLQVPCCFDFSQISSIPVHVCIFGLSSRVVSDGRHRDLQDRSRHDIACRGIAFFFTLNPIAFPRILYGIGPRGPLVAPTNPPPLRSLFDCWRSELMVRFRGLVRLPSPSRSRSRSSPRPGGRGGERS